MPRSPQNHTNGLHFPYEGCQNPSLQLHPHSEFKKIDFHNMLNPEVGTDNANIARKQSKSDKHGHEKGKSVQKSGI
ncbi:hypothetical protein Tco_0853722 [Tanacetum coccineum]